MFSPYYARARRHLGDAGARPQGHCALNLSLYRRPPGRKHYERLWAMTERGEQQLQRSERLLQIGTSHLAWGADGDLHIDVNEWTVPWPQRLRGHIHLQPRQLPGQAFPLDAAGCHQWQPISPRARIELDFDAPRLRWQGDAYLDANRGARPLERDFESWQWSRCTRGEAGSHVLYELQGIDGAERALALDFAADGGIQALPLPLPPRQVLPATAWGLDRSSRAGQPPELMATLESGPFYSRSLLRDPANGSLSVHESLSLKRFSQPWVQALLPFRMPRRAR